jgi:hypothetical protein
VISWPDGKTNRKGIIKNLDLHSGICHKVDRSEDGLGEDCLEKEGATRDRRHLNGDGAPPNPRIAVNRENDGVFSPSLSLSNHELAVEKGPAF